ncbi:MAG: hypothetical protein IKS37_09025 [Solobacterium sp.]|nr:hypothetical protein [Solobacterium sp.]
MNAKTLIVGLGGSGSRILTHLVKNFTEQEKENTSFIALDHDQTELRCLQEENSSIQTISIAQKHTLEQCVFYEADARDSWFPLHLVNTMNFTNPSRAASRLAFQLAIRQGKLQSLDHILHHEKPEQIILTGSCFGYTGSAMVLPLSLHIRQILHDKTNICGVFLMPDVYDPLIRSHGEYEKAREHTYAFLRELNAFTAEEAGVLDETYTIGMNLPRPASMENDMVNGRPLDLCFLLSADPSHPASSSDIHASAAVQIQDVMRTSVTDQAGALGAHDVCRYALFHAGEAAAHCCRPSDLPGFSRDGVYYEIYHRTIAAYDPRNYVSRVITPHLDRSWHDSACFPDLDVV